MSEKERIQCDKDKAHYVVATCILVRNGKYLIAKRSDKEKAFPGKWTVPGGKLETRDYMERKFDTDKGNQWYNVLESLVRREVMEEVGLEIGDIGYVTSLVFIRHDGIPTLVISLYSENCCGEIKLSDELSEHRWIALEEAKSYDLIDGIYEEIEMLDRYLKGEKLGEWKSDKFS